MLARSIRRSGGAFVHTLATKGIYLRDNERRLANLEGIHKGRQAFIVGMGPSLRTSDLDLLRNELTFCCNKIFLAFNETDFRPSYYSICDELVGKNNAEAILSADFGNAVLLHAPVVKPYLSEQKGALFYRYGRRCMQQEPKNPEFPERFIDGLVSGGYSILIDQIQMAFLMGCRRIVMLGVDFSFYFAKEDRIGMQSNSGEVLRSQGEVNHFHPDYRKPGETWTVPKMDEQRNAFLYCKEAVESAGGQLLNASRTSKLDVLPRISLEEALDFQQP